jgi:archaeosine-15-forming tRNA-guanine transglycosylase
MINEEILTEKIKYIIMSESGKDFEIMNVDLEMDYMANDNSTIESYRVFVKFDYNNVIEADIFYFTKDIIKMSEKMRDIISKYVIDSKGKLIQGGKNTSISEGDIWTLDFAADERHIFDMSYLIVPNKED